MRLGRSLFLKGSTNRGILRASVLIAGVGITVKLMATAKEFVAAGIYGRSDAMDAFLLAFLVPNLLVNLIAESMNQALVPTLIKEWESGGKEAAQRLMSQSFLMLCALLLVAIALMAAVAPWLIAALGHRFSAEKLQLTVRLFYQLLPVILLSGVACNGVAILNAVERFALPALSGILPPLVSVLCLLRWGRMGIEAMVIGLLAGLLLQVLVVAWLMESHGFRMRFGWQAERSAAHEVLLQYGPVMGSGLVASGGLLVDQAMAAHLEPGSLSALVYANRFVSVAITLLGGALSAAVVPYFSRMVARRAWAECRHTLRLWLGVSALVTVPLMALLMLGAGSLIRITLQHGVFSAQDTSLVRSVLVLYALQIPFFVMSRVDYRFLVTLRRTDLVLWCGLLNLLLDVLLNLLLMRLLGVAGIALATSLWTVSTFFFLRYWSARLLHRAEAASAGATP